MFQTFHTNYFKKVIAKEGGLGGEEAPALGRGAVDTLKKRKVQYNWPYDYFSLVELVKIDAEVEFNNADYTDFFQNLPHIITQKATDSAIDLMNADPDLLFNPVKSRQEAVEKRGKGPGGGRLIDTDKGLMINFANLFMRHVNNGYDAKRAKGLAYGRIYKLFPRVEVAQYRDAMEEYALNWAEANGDTSLEPS